MRNVGDLTEGVMGLKGRQGSGGSMWVTEYIRQRQERKRDWTGAGAGGRQPKVETQQE